MTAIMTKRNRTVILIIILLSTFVTVTDTSSLNVVLPTIATELNISMSQVEWIPTSFLLGVICTILFWGKLGDMYGKDHIFKIGLAIFCFGEILSFLSPSILPLIIGRVVAAVGASGIMANNQAIIAEIYAPGERGKAMGLTGSIVALGNMTGPAFGGFISHYFSWSTIFLLGMVLSLVNLILCWQFFPTLTRQKPTGNDYPGAFLFAIFIMSFYLLIKAQQSGGWSLPVTLAVLVLILLSGILLDKREKAIPAPMIDFTLFQNKAYSISIFCSFLSFFAIACSNFLIPFYAQRVLEYTPLMTGLVMMIYPTIMIVIAPLSGHFSDKIHPHKLTFAGLLIATIGMYFLSFLAEASQLSQIIIAMGTMAFGFSLFQSPNTNAIMSAVPRHKLGFASSMNALVRNLGMVLGISLSTVLLYHFMTIQAGYPVADFIPGRADIFVTSMQHVYRLITLSLAGGVALSAYLLRLTR